MVTEREGSTAVFCFFREASQEIKSVLEHRVQEAHIYARSLKKMTRQSSGSVGLVSVCAFKPKT